MVTVTFTATDGSVEVVGQVLYDSKYHSERYNQRSMRVASDDLITYDNKGYVVKGVLTIKNVSYEDGELLRTWLHEKAIFQLNKFTIVTSSDDINLGIGKDITLTEVNFVGDNDSGVFKYRMPGFYIIKFPYTYLTFGKNTLFGSININIVLSGSLVLRYIVGSIDIIITCSGTLTDAPS